MIPACGNVYPDTVCVDTVYIFMLMTHVLMSIVIPACVDVCGFLYGDVSICMVLAAIC